MQQPQPTPTASAGRRSWPTWVNGRGAVWLLLPKCGAAGHGGTRRPLPGKLVMNSRGRRDSTAETNLRKERQMEGIAKTKAAGVYKGRPCVD